MQCFDLLVVCTGVYAALEDGLAALEDDVRAACDLFRSAAKRAGSDFAADLADVSCSHVSQSGSCSWHDRLLGLGAGHPSFHV